MGEEVRNVSALSGRKEPRKGTLDYYPTDLYIARAALDRALRSGLYDFDYDRSMSVLEPACGQGHMAELLLEFFDRVWPYDIKDYGYRRFLGERNFLQRIKGKTSAETFQPREHRFADWVITNPPFGSLTLPFALEALRRADRGVAFLLRLSNAEGIDRWREAFRPIPPALILQFPDRVGLHKGEVKQEDGGAVAYAWFFWKRTRTEFDWIPPGSKELIREGDYDTARLLREGFEVPKSEENWGLFSERKENQDGR